MLSTLEKQLSEAQRDALVTGYLKFVGPTLHNVGSAQLTNEDLYEYLLLDPQVADEAMTSRVASAIASVQTYITRIVNRSEPGFPPVDPAHADVWRDNDSQYAIWAASMEIQNYAENYISPVTRQEKSHYFADLEATLNQNQLDPDRVQDAALSYLNQFEAVSNLYVVSGYIDQADLTTATYYFIGRTTTKPYQYYWRKMDLSLNDQDNAGGTPVTPNCWSDWLPVSLPLAPDTVLKHTVRPVFYNQRLYVAWVERNPSPQMDAYGNSTSNYAYRLNFGYKRFDDTWTAPNGAMMQISTTQGEAASDTLVITESSGVDSSDVNLLAITDFSDDGGAQAVNSYGRLMLGVFVRAWSEELEQNAPSVYGYQYCDSAFNSRELDSVIRQKLFGSFQDKDDAINTLQYPLFTHKYTIDHVAPYADSDTPPGPDGSLGAGDLNGADKGDESYTGSWWEKINDLVASDSGSSSYVYMKDDFTLFVEMTLNDDFLNEYDFQSGDTNSGGTSGYGFGPPDGSAGATIRYHDDHSHTFVNTALRYDPTTFGSGSVSDGTYDVCVLGGSNIFSDAPIFTVDIVNNNIGFHGTGTSNKFLDLSGMKIGKGPIWGSADSGAFSAYFFVNENGSPQIAEIKNFGQVGMVRPFNCAIRLVTSHYDNVSAPQTHTYELGKDSTWTNSLVLSDFALPPGEGYVSVCLAVQVGRLRWPDQSDMGGTASVWKWFKVYITNVNMGAVGPLPQIKSNYDPVLGLAQYLDFCDPLLPANTRLNTTFVRTLIEKANLSLDSLLDYTLQTRLLEAPLVPGGQAEPMDFNGANGLYFWELFFHMPFLVAWRFANEQQFGDAQTWLHYIFDPSAADKDSGAPDYWNVRPLTTSGQPSLMIAAPLDPDACAYADPVIYQKAVFIAYVSNLVAQGDVCYRQLTRDGLTQARVFYGLAAQLLGRRPDVTLSSTWTPQTLNALAKAQNDALRDFEAAIDLTKTNIVASSGKAAGYLLLADNPNFIAPLDTLLLGHWDTLDSRVYNLRHSLTIDGKPMSLALYEPPADPIALLVQRAQSGTVVNAISGAQLAVPPYRFNAVLERAYNAVAALTTFGESLLSLIERGDNASREELQQQQLLDMSSYAITLQQQAINSLAADRESLTASQATAQHRYDSYSALYEGNVSSGEQLVMDTHNVAQSILKGSEGVMTASGALKLLPNIFGFSDGGSRFEGATEAVAHGLIASGQGKEVSAERLSTTEGYRRRREDWQIQYVQAQHEVDTVGKQLDAHAVRASAATMELTRLTAQQAQIQTMLTFMRNKRFTQASLYQWLSGQLAAVFFQIYDAVMSLCLSAQACWQYELCDFETTFVQTGAWNDQYRGLHVGKTLNLNLRQMEAAYLARYERRLEITRTVSLLDLYGAQDKFDAQRSTGQFVFELTEQLFDRDYPGHYMRQIKSISISLPTLLGPYQDVKATLTQTKSSTLLNASLDGVKYLGGQSNSKGTGNIVMNLRASQQIALSSGLNDAGLFELNFGDERYVPFEGTGAVSGWTLAFPRYTQSADQQAVVNALTDVIVHVRYTALDGGDTFASQVETTLGS